MRKLVCALGIVASLLVVVACGRKPVEPPPTADAASKRVVNTGEVVGSVGAYDNHVWRGLPFAKAPTGDLRWSAPRPPEPWTGTREALASGSACPQFASLIGGVDAEPGSVIGSEDCLYLNVFAPRFEPAAVPKAGALLPVMFWIHGGGNSIGQAGTYDGGRIAVSENVVVVATNYRLGPLGWFSNPAVSGPEATPLDLSGNYGTLDLVRALAWVRENAEAFGGDPERVTIFGESAGGTNVMSLLLSPLAKGLFHRAIVQSGGVSNTTVAEARAGNPDDGPNGSTGSDAIVAKLGDAPRSRNAEEILRAYPGEVFMGMLSIPTVIRDGVVLPEAEMREAFARGEYNQVPIVLGSNRDETKLFIFGDPTLVRRWFGIFPMLRVPEERYQLISEYGAKAWKAGGVDSLATVLRAAQGPSVYAYRFDWDEEPTLLFADYGVLLGAAHGFEIPFVFGHWKLGGAGDRLFDSSNESGREALSAQMRSYWAQFAYTGDPGRGRKSDLVPWTAWDDSTAESPKYIVLDTESDAGVRMSYETYTRERILAELREDPRLPTWRDKCGELAGLATFSGYITPADYAAESGCADYALATWPWQE
jgi:para-nitrobenzyl esterase